MELDPMVISMHTHSLRLTHSVCEPHSAQISYIISCYFIHAIRKYVHIYSLAIFFCGSLSLFNSITVNAVVLLLLMLLLFLLLFWMLLLLVLLLLLLLHFRVWCVWFILFYTSFFVICLPLRSWFRSSLLLCL